MPTSAFGHALETLHDGLTTFRQDSRFVPSHCPLTGTEIHVTPIGPFASVRITRRFRNVEDAPIEAVLTMPVAFDAVVTGLSVIVGDRTLIARAQAKDTARGTYEDAIDRGKLAILHEEVLRGVHMLSVANLDAGAEVMVTHEIAMPLTRLTSGALLRLPMTVGALYGTSPLSPVDDLVSSSAIVHEASLLLDSGRAELVGRGIFLRAGSAVDLPLDSAIELRFDAVADGKVSGTDAIGRAVSIEIQPAVDSDGFLDLAILVDRSGSTGAPVGDALSVHQAMAQGLAATLIGVRGDDRFGLWQFDNDCQFLGAATGPESAQLVSKLDGPRGGTELGTALRTLVDRGARDVLVMTDGQTWAYEVDELAALPARVSAVLVGSASLDANIGHLATMTGGQVFHSPGANVGAVLEPALQALRLTAGPAVGRVVADRPVELTAQRAGWVIKITWDDVSGIAIDPHAEVLGRYAAALALPLLSTEAASVWAVQHDLCTHATSLVLVDEASSIAAEGAAGAVWPNLRKVPLQARAVHCLAEDRAAIRFHVAPTAKSAARPARSGLREALSMFRKPLRRAERSLRKRLDLLAARINWSVDAARFLLADISSLTPDELATIQEFAASSAVRERARDLPYPTQVVALAILAAACVAEDRYALRFARRVLGELGLDDAVSCHAEVLGGGRT